MWSSFRRDKKGLREAQEALDGAREALSHTRDQGRVVGRLAREIQDYLRPNHFAERLEGIIISPSGRRPYDT